MEIGRIERVDKHITSSGVSSSASCSKCVDLEKRIEMLERTLAGLQVLLGKASEYRARPRRERLP